MKRILKVTDMLFSTTAFTRPGTTGHLPSTWSQGRRKPGLSGLVVLLACWLFGCVVTATGQATVNPTMQAGSSGPSPFIPRQLEQDLVAGKPRQVLVLFEDAAERHAAEQAESLPRQRLTDRATRYQTLKEGVLTRLRLNNAELIEDFSHLPMSWIRVRGPAGLEWLRSRSDIVALYANEPLFPTLGQSLTFIDQPEVAQAGLTAAGVTVAVLDTGVDYGHAAFGSCTAPGVPATCRVAASLDVAPDDGTTDDSKHGTNVSGIIAGAAPAAKLAVLDIFSGNSSDSALLVAGLNWVLANHESLSIKVVNMSLSDGSRYTAPCGNRLTNPFLGAIDDLRAVGISVVASSGNNGYSKGISNPACTPGVISVGAVYDTNIGAQNWGVCTDTTSSPDKVICFSNSASFLTMLAPGAKITAAGYEASGTSQASPHVAAAAAVLIAAQPQFTPNEIAARLTSTGAVVTDSRNEIQFHRLNMAAALAPEIAELNGSSGDVPFLPPWALGLLATSMCIAGLRRIAQKNTRVPRP